VIIAVVAGLLLLPLLSFQMIPDSSFRHAVQVLLTPQGISIDAHRLGARFPLALTAENLTLGDSEGSWIKLDQCTIRLQLLPLLTGRVRCSIAAQVGKGNISGELTLYPKKAQGGDIHAERLRLAEIPAITNRLGSQTEGLARFDLNVSRQKGIILGYTKLQIKDIRLKESQLGGFRLPDLAIPEARGLLKIQGQIITAENMALQGEGVYLRLTGSSPISVTAPINLSLELLPTAEFFERQKSIFMFMFPYQISPGNYRLPIGGTLAHPLISSPKSP
jgi:type II secretion system protein N